KPKIAADAFGIRLLALPVTSLELLGEVRAGSGIPLFVNSIENTGQTILACAHTQEPIEAASKLGVNDLARVGLADGRHVTRVEDPRLHKRNVIVEFNSIDLKRAFRGADPAEALARE